MAQNGMFSLDGEVAVVIGGGGVLAEIGRAHV